MLTKLLPRFVIAKPLAGGRIGFYFTVPTYYRKQGCTIPNETLGSDYEVACGDNGDGGRAAALNGLFDEWRARLAGEPIESIARYGTVDWLFREYKSSKAYLEKVSKRSRPDYERTMLLLVADTLTNKEDRIGSRLIRSITPRGADKEEWRAAQAKSDKEYRKTQQKFEKELLKYVRGEPHNIKPETNEESKAKIAKKLAEEDATLLLPVNRKRFRSEIESTFQREVLQVPF
jgi:hypothetical protein